MDQNDTDNLLLASLVQFGFSFGGKKINHLFEIDGDILRLIAFQFLEFMGSSVTQNSLKGQQKFRQSTKISEEMRNLYNMRIDINSLLAPSKDDLRKIVVLILQKISMHEDGDNPRLNISQRGGAPVFETYEERVKFMRDQRRKDTLKSWVQEEWIHPALGNTRFNSFRAYDQELALDSDSLRNKLIINIIDGKMKANLYSSLVKIIENRTEFVKKEEFIKENFYADEFVKRAEKQHLVQIEQIKQQVAVDLSKASKKKVGKLAEQLIEKPLQTEEEVKQTLETEKQTIFNLEVQFVEEQQQQPEEEVQEEVIEEVKPQVVRQEEEKSAPVVEKKVVKKEKAPKKLLGADFDIEALKAKHQAEIDELMTTYQALTKKMEKYESKRVQMEDNTQQKIEEGEVLKEQNKLTKREIDNMELLIKELESKGGSSQLKQEIAEIEQDIKEIESQWTEYQANEVNTLNEFKTSVQQQKETAELVRDKSKRIDQEYQTLINDIRNNHEKYEKLVEDFKRMPSGSNRQDYVKKIMEIKKNYDKQRGDIQKIVKDVKEIDESISYYQSTLERHMSELEGIYNSDSKKNESLSKQIYRIYHEYRSIFENTANNLREIGSKKIETRGIESKAIILSTKHYDKSIEKLQSDIDEIKLENAQLAKTAKN